MIKILGTKILRIVVLSLLWCNLAYSQDCSHIDYEKNEQDFVTCIKTKYNKVNSGLIKCEDKNKNK